MKVVGTSGLSFTRSQRLKETNSLTRKPFSRQVEFRGSHWELFQIKIKICLFFSLLCVPSKWCFMVIRHNREWWVWNIKELRLSQWVCSLHNPQMSYKLRLVFNHWHTVELPGVDGWVTMLPKDHVPWLLCQTLGYPIGQLVSVLDYYNPADLVLWNT